MTTTGRTALLDRLRGCYLGDRKPDTLAGGRTEALRRLHAYDPAAPPHRPHLFSDEPTAPSLFDDWDTNTGSA